MGFGYLLALIALLTGVGALTEYNRWVAVEQESAGSAGMTAAAFAAHHRSAVTWSEANPAYVGDIDNNQLIYPGWFLQRNMWRSYVSPDRVVQSWPVTMDPAYLGVTRAAFLNEFVQIANGDAGSGIKRDGDLYTPAQGRTERFLYISIPEEFPVHTTRLVAPDPANPTIRTSDAQTIACPAGMVGSIYQVRDVATTAGVPVYSPWVEVGRTCDTAITNYEYRVESCQQSYGTLAPAHIVYRRQSIRNGDGSVSTGAWAEFFRSCPTITQSSPIATVIVPIDTSGANCSNIAWAAAHADICNVPIDGPCETMPLENPPATPPQDAAFFTVCRDAGSCDAFDVMQPHSFTAPLSPVAVPKTIWLTSSTSMPITSVVQSNMTAAISSPDVWLRGMSAAPASTGVPLAERPTASSRLVIDPTLTDPGLSDRDFWHTVLSAQAAMPVATTEACVVQNIDQMWPETGGTETDLIQFTINALAGYTLSQPLDAAENRYAQIGLLQRVAPQSFSIDALAPVGVSDPSARLFQGGLTTPPWYLGPDPMVSGVPAYITVPAVILAWAGVPEDQDAACTDAVTGEGGPCYRTAAGRAAQDPAWPTKKYDTVSRRIGYPTLRDFLLGKLRYPDGRRPAAGEPGHDALDGAGDPGNDDTIMQRYFLHNNMSPILANWVATTARSRSMYAFPTMHANASCWSRKAWENIDITSLDAQKKARLYSRLKVKRCNVR